MRYEVTSDRLALGPAGTTLAAKDLAGCNVQALVAAGHIRAIRPNRNGHPAADSTKEQ